MDLIPVAAAATDKPYAFWRRPGPVPGTWVVTLSCTHGVTTCYLAAQRLDLPDEGVAILQLLVARHRSEQRLCRCLDRPSR